MDKTTEERARRLTALGATHEAKFIEALREATMADGSAGSRWLVASLLAINGAGALASINAVERGDSLLSGAAFLGGILAALASGWLNQRFSFGELPTINALHGYWLAIADSGVADLNQQEELQPALSAMNARGRRGPWAGWASAIFFTVGAVLLATTSGPSDVFNDVRCYAIQSDMLRDHPRRADGPALFQALGCRPQGDGLVGFPAAGQAVVTSPPARSAPSPASPPRPNRSIASRSSPPR